MKREFISTFEYVSTILDRYRLSGVSSVISPSDDMAHPSWDKNLSHYKSVGANAIEIILTALLCCRKHSKIESILDMPSGFGRVTRHLASAFADSTLFACDLYQDRIDFCAKTFNARPIKSHKDLTLVKFPMKFDLIWCGSLLSHLQAPELDDVLELFSSNLTDRGIAIFTTLGRASPFIHKTSFKYVPQDIYESSGIEAQFARNGFGYAEYGEPERFFEQDTYGIAFAEPSFILKRLERDRTIRIRGVSERAWDDQQDAIVVQKTPIENPLKIDLK